jgi:PIN domain nuclease of toxin-antitoxin system
VSVYVTDTHPLIWYAASAHRQLSRKALGVFNSASLAESLVYVPVFVLWEIAMLLKIGRIALREPYPVWVENLSLQRGFALPPQDITVLSKAYSYPFADPFDSVITATAQVLELPLITKDTAISDSRLVEIYW